MDNATNDTISVKCKLEPGDFVGTHVVQAKIGRGYFSTVYRCVRGNDQDGPPVAIKIYGNDLEEYFRNEVQLLKRISSEHIVSMYDMFAYIDRRTAAIYPCIIMELRGDSVLKLINHCKEECGTGLPIPMVLAVTRDMLAGLAYLHENGIIHGDIKPDNLLLDRKITEDLTADDIHIKLVDFGSSSTIDNIFTTKVGTVGYIAPEIVVGREFGTPADIWSAFTVIFELIAGDSLFDVFFECDINYGDVDESVVLAGPDDDWITCKPCSKCNQEESTDIKYSSCECGLCDTCGTHDSCTRVPTGSADESDEPEYQYARTYCYLLLVAKVIGYPPIEFTEDARDYYNRRGRLISNPDVIPTTISALLGDNYSLDADLCARIEEFLLCGLKYDPCERISAAGALKHGFCV